MTAASCSFRCCRSVIPCYSSTDLYHWTYQSRALTLQPSGDLGPHRIVERPKVIYTAATATHVMYLHIDSPSYAEAKVGVATSTTPCGPYTYRSSFQPLGFQSRDIDPFQDTDGPAYLLSEDRANGLRIDRPGRRSSCCCAPSAGRATRPTRSGCCAPSWSSGRAPARSAGTELIRPVNPAGPSRAVLRKALRASTLHFRHAQS
ncbi:hypothetical protein [Streptomyces sp. NRRL S-350]|uniref:hypothetical protein n=1 Tax=Streptomyces sp. NRRL S-350 TaxID=1463902 RepID=UPI001F23CFA2|nr:hypothetical protein [Streptomyces sp. NRRL S-350]